MHIFFWVESNILHFSGSQELKILEKLKKHYLYVEK